MRALGIGVGLITVLLAQRQVSAVKSNAYVHVLLLQQYASSVDIKSSLFEVKYFCTAAILS